MERLYRSKDKVIGGLCGGLGEFFVIDPTLIRLGWAVATIFAGLNILVYIIGWIIVPEKPEVEGYKPKDDLDTSNSPKQTE